MTKVSPEEQLKRAQQRKNRAIAAENRAKEQIRKAEHRAKYELGGLAVKAGFKEIEPNALFGAFCFISAMLRVNPARKEIEGYFNLLGQAAWERFEIEKDPKYLKGQTEEDLAAIISDLHDVIQRNPFPGSNHFALPKSAGVLLHPRAQGQNSRIEYHQQDELRFKSSIAHAGFDQEA